MSLFTDTSQAERDGQLTEYLRAKKTFAKEKRSRLFLVAKKNKKLMFGAVMLTIIILVAIFAPVIAPYSYREMTTDLLQKPSAEHLFGTDNFGRDLFSRVVYGSRISLGIALLCVALGTVIGVPLGMLSGYIGGWFDIFIMRVSDVFLSIPWVLMAVTVTAIIGSGVQVIIIALGLVYTPGAIRLARSLVLTIRHREYVEAARVIGESKWSILWRYVFPNCTAPILVQTTLRLSSAVLSEAAISYLGYGTQPPLPSWGLLLADAQQFMWQAPYLSIFPGIAMVLLVLSGNMFGDGLRDLIDPKTRGKVT
jgi:peptide/nickel transport system permease protein